MAEINEAEEEENERFFLKKKYFFLKKNELFFKFQIFITKFTNSSPFKSLVVWLRFLQQGQGCPKSKIKRLGSV